MINKFENLFLAMVAVGLTLIGFGYGIDPDFYPKLFGFSIDSNINAFHTFRAFNGLYISLGLFWLSAIFCNSIKKGAVVSIIFVMIGLALGRIISLIIDGSPHPLLQFYLGLEIFVLLQGLFIYYKKYAESNDN